MVQDRLFPATVMPDRNWWHALWPDPDGYFTAAIARQAGPGRVVGFDLDPERLEQAQAACEGLANCDWLLGDAMELSRLLGAPADYVLIANTFHGVPDKTASAREVATALKPGGRFAVVNWHPLQGEETTVLGQPRGPSTELRMSPGQTRAVVEPAGFKLEALVELPSSHYGLIFVCAN